MPGIYSEGALLVSDETERATHERDISGSDSSLALPTAKYSHQLKAGLFFLFGISMLLPWNSWITITSYFRTTFKNTPFSDNFNSWFSLTFMASNIVFLLIFVRFPYLGLKNRIIIGFLLSVVCFSMASLMPWSNINSQSYFFCTLILIVISSGSSSFLTGIMGLVASYDPAYLAYMASGQGMGGILPSVFQIVMLKSTMSKNMIAAYFGSTVVLAVISCVGLYALFHIEPPKPYSSEEYMSIEDAVTANEHLPPVRAAISLYVVFRSVQIYLFAVFLNFFVILAVFPGITSSIKSINTDPLRPPIQSVLFVPLHFLCLNIFDWIGKSLPTMPMFSKLDRNRILLYSVLRLGFIPLFLTCNLEFKTSDGIALPRALPLVFGDQFYFLFVAIFALTSGYLNSITFIEAGNALPHELSAFQAAHGLAGDMMGISLALGLAIGSLFSFALRAGLCSCNPFIS